MGGGGGSPPAESVGLRMEESADSGRASSMAFLGWPRLANERNANAGFGSILSGGGGGGGGIIDEE